MHPIRAFFVSFFGGLSLPLESNLACSARAQPLWLCHHPEAESRRREAWAQAHGRTRR